MPKSKKRKTTKRKPRRRRLWTEHPGVKLKPRDRTGGGTSWRAIYVEPETLETQYLTLDHIGITTPEARTEWAVRMSKELARRRAVVASAGALPVPVEFEVAVKEFLDANAARLRPSTIESYRMSLGIFLRWAVAEDLDMVLRLNPPLLAKFRKSLVSGDYTRRSRTGKRQKDPVKPERAYTPWHYNHVLRAVASFLREGRRLGRTPHLTAEGIAESLRQLSVPKVQPRPFKPLECAALQRRGTRPRRGRPPCR